MPHDDLAMNEVKVTFDDGTVDGSFTVRSNDEILGQYVVNNLHLGRQMSETPL